MVESEDHKRVLPGCSGGRFARTAREDGWAAGEKGAVTCRRRDALPLGAGENGEENVAVSRAPARSASACLRLPTRPARAGMRHLRVTRNVRNQVVTSLRVLPF